MSDAPAPVVAAIDVGTQSTRLLVSNAHGELLRRSVITHLGRGVSERRSFDPQQLVATLDTLRAFRRDMDDLGVTHARGISTEAVRLAADPSLFLRPASEVLRFDLELISGTQEGCLAFDGATAGLDQADAPFVTIDLGGGSCEFALGTDHCEQVFSATFGASVLTEAYIEHDPPRPEELLAALSIVQAHIDEVARVIPELRDAGSFIGLGGTFSTMAAVEIGLADHDRDAVNGFLLTRSAAEDVFRTLVTESYADRLHNPGLDPARARTIVGGSCAVVAIMRYFGLDAVRVSEADLLDAIVSDLLHDPRN